MGRDAVLRAARADDAAPLVELWALLFDDDDDGRPSRDEPWREHAGTWFASAVDAPELAYFPVVEVDAAIVATAIGTLELGVPNPHCPTGRTVRLANVVTLPDHRGNGYGTRLVHDVVRWARGIAADRVDLSATPEGQRIYDAAGFVLTSAPRMKLLL